MKACFQIAECSFFLCKDTTFLRVNYTLMGIGRKKSAKKLWITYKIVNNLALDGRKVPFLGAIATGPQLLNEGRAAVDPSHQVVDSHVALGVREIFVGEVVLADVVFLHDRCLISSLAI